jgi:hypothetical protein
MSQHPKQQETDLSQTPQSETGTLTLAPIEFFMKIQSSVKELIRIMPDGTIIAPDLESASEAGKLFIESIRIHGKPLLERVQELEKEVETLKQQIHEMHQGDQIF